MSNKSRDCRNNDDGSLEKMGGIVLLTQEDVVGGMMY